MLDRTVAQVVAGWRLDLHHVRAGLSQEKPGVRTVVDLAEIEYADAVQW